MSRLIVRWLTMGAVLGLVLMGVTTQAQLTRPERPSRGDGFLAFTCPPDSVRSGRTCMDTFEASIWETTNATLIKLIKDGTVTLGDLTAAGAIQRGVTTADYGAGCPQTGNGCLDFYAVSIPGVFPSRFISWFQAVAAARNAEKRLPTIEEWQAAALGTPDTGGADDGKTDCNTDDRQPGPTPTGSRSNCFSDVGAFDMVGNLLELVADWVPLSTTCVTPLFGTSDINCLAGASRSSGPGAVKRGGDHTERARAGVFAVSALSHPDGRSAENARTGFRAVR